MDKYCLITGASSGIGYEFARIFAKNKYNLILVARRIEKLEEIKKELVKQYNIDVLTYKCDLTNKEEINSVYDDLKEKNIFVHTLVNNAGFGYHSFYPESDYKKQENLLKLNIEALSYLSYLFSKEMCKNKCGEILNIASIAAYSAGPYATTYYSSKAYVLSFSEGLAEELKEYGVTVSCICPGPTKTEFEKTASLETSNMFKTLPVAKASTVAKIGFNALKHKRVIVHCGFFVKFGAFLYRIFPRALARKVSKNVNKKPQ